MNRPTKRSGSSFEQFRKRIPREMLQVVRGKRATISLPPEFPGDQDVLVNITIGAEVRFSLQTRDPALAKRRNAAATDQLDRVLRALVDGPRPLTQKQRTALAGIIYRAFTEAFEDEPISARLWAQIQEHNAVAMFGSVPSLAIANSPKERDRIERHNMMDRRFGKFVDAILLREGVVTDHDSRNALLQDFGRALTEAAAKLQRNAEGDYRDDPVADRFPQWMRISSSPPQNAEVLTFHNLLNRWEAEGYKAPSSKQSFRAVVAAFTTYVGHDDVRRVTKANIRNWKDALLAKKLSAKTINGSYLAHIRTLYGLASREDLHDFDPTKGVRVPQKKKAGEKELPYNDDEVATILALANEETLAYLRWIPWLLACTGARVGEIAQLWGKHVKQVDGIYVISITPTEDDGTVKTAGSERDVPLHHAIIDLGFLSFVATRNGGPLFYGGKNASPRPRKSDTSAHASDGPTNRVREWIRRNGFTNPRKAPNHAFRHWFKTRCLRLGIPNSIADAIQGHAGNGGEADTYRHIDVQMMAEAFQRFSLPGFNKGQGLSTENMR